MKLINLELENSSTLQFITDTEEPVNEVAEAVFNWIIEIITESRANYVIDPFDVNFISIEEVEE